MKVCVYKGSEKIVRKSGVGIAMRHQEAILKKAGFEVTSHLDDETDAIHINTVFPDSAVKASMAKKQHKMVVYYGHSTMEDFRNSFKGSNSFAPFFKKWIKHCYNKGDIILTPTEYSKSLLQSYGIKKPIIALSNGIDIDKFVPDEKKRKKFREKYHIPEDKKVVLSVGHYIERKGILDFIELAKKMPDVLFMWFGYTSPKLIPEKIASAIKSAPSNLVFPGYVPPEDLRYAYQGCDLFCFMSHEETEGIVILEALACELPVLVRDIPVYGGWLEDGINSYKAESIDDFADKTRKILNHELPDLTMEGRKVAEERSFAAIAEKMKAIYKQYYHKKK